jgi:hypothetical protein
MSTSGTTSFTLDSVEIIDEAFERAGRKARTGYDFKTAIRSLNLLLADWANRGINLWSVEQGSQLLTPGVSTYTLPADTVDLIEHVIRTGSGTTQVDLTISRISVSTYATIPTKTAIGRPIEIYINRTLPAPQFTVWPVPDSSAVYTLIYYRLRRLQDAGTGVTNQDIPFRFLPCLVAGLSFMVATKIPEGTERIQLLKEQYDEAWQLASGEDRDRAPVRFVPRRMVI